MSFPRSRSIAESIEGDRREAIYGSRAQQAYSGFGRKMEKVCNQLIARIFKLINILLFCSNVMCLQKISSTQDLIKMKKILGVQPQDQALIAYWSIALAN